MYAILIVALSVALLSFLIMKLRFNAFFSLVITAIFVGVLSGLSLAEADFPYNNEVGRFNFPALQ